MDFRKSEQTINTQAGKVFVYRKAKNVYWAGIQGRNVWSGDMTKQETKKFIEKMNNTEYITI